ncbi:MAG: hypothetical protein LCH81_21020 [Bacteroidetes bacterium]|nr:hypothetical protein [Bacteroidota bacterium]
MNLHTSRILAAPAIAAILFLLWLGCRNQPDPVWIESGRLMRMPSVLIADVPDSLQNLYCQLHRRQFQSGDTTALHLVSQPSLSNIEWTAFQKMTRAIAGADKRRIVVSGVTGTGATKQAKRASLLVAGDAARVLQIDCAPAFDLEYHKKYIGQDNDNGQFVPGELLQLWKKCAAQPDLPFVAVIDNFDKINPETFWGPALWEALSSKNPEAEIGGQTYRFPKNFYLVSITHLGPGSQVEFNEEHFKRLGKQYTLDPNPLELLAVMRLMQQKTDLSPEQAKAVRDVAETRRFLYYFLKINQLLRTRYGDGYQMGQGTGLRELFCDSDRTELKQTVLNHLNALKPDNPLELDDFDDIDQTIQDEGLQPGTNFMARQIQYLHDTGYFVEITMVATTALLTALVGWWVFRRREQLIRHYGEQARDVYDRFEKQLESAEGAARRLEEIKNEVDGLVLKRKLGYTEGLYFLAFIEDKVKRIEFARNVSENFLELFNAFMEDNVLTESEYLKLKQFLQSIRHKIPVESYEAFHRKVEDTYAAPDTLKSFTSTE